MDKLSWAVCLLSGLFVAICLWLSPFWDTEPSGTIPPVEITCSDQAGCNP
jgi:hypothetical protein